MIATCNVINKKPGQQAVRMASFTRSCTFQELGYFNLPFALPLPFKSNFQNILDLHISHSFNLNLVINTPCNFLIIWLLLVQYQSISVKDWSLISTGDIYEDFF